MRSETYNTDCIEYMRSLPDNAFDIAVCDPPYGNGNDESLVGGGVSTDTTKRDRFGGRFRRYYKPMEQTLGRPKRKILQSSGHTDSAAAHGLRDTNWSFGWVGKSEAPQWDVAPPQEFFEELFRVSRNQIIWGGNYFTLPPTRCFLVWRKTSIAESFTMAMVEYAWTSFTGNAKVFDCSPQRKKHSGKFHPTEKPLELYGWIYRNYVKGGETVFDPMMGSQASRIAAYKMGINYVGCEIDEYYYNKGCEWFERECHGITKTTDGKTIIEQKLFDL